MNQRILEKNISKFNSKYKNIKCHYCNKLKHIQTDFVELS